MTIQNQYIIRQISKLPIRQLIADDTIALLAEFSKLPIRQLIVLIQEILGFDDF